MKSPNSKLNAFSMAMIFVIPVLWCFAACTERTGPTKVVSQSTIAPDPKTSGSTPAPQKQPLNSIKEIQQAYMEINQKIDSGTVDSAAVKYSCDHEKAGTISYFTEKGKLRLIVHRYNEYDHYSAEDRYYIKDNILFFAYTNSLSWSFESGPEGSTKDNITEKRVYFAGGRPIRCLEKKFVVRSKVPNNPGRDAIPSHAVDCAEAYKIQKSYYLLTKFRERPGQDCLD
jgi:hypothetical protein